MDPTRATGDRVATLLDSNWTIMTSYSSWTRPNVEDQCPCFVPIWNENEFEKKLSTNIRLPQSGAFALKDSIQALNVCKEQ
eukprot:CAMPEP_0185848566 /NCGR_PEP_ID=MMETSP1354-20130828/3396_1 /TAXON_ID=708628 /ORGANISM="Erythrolobus madagascarensis, Strain CCMP3276" /LENGTH=80 /DNA_ID=CAMNT_0028548977 /DNA_START=541 /DNA_END=783 /DNA_ORIENTATION=-